MLCLEQPGRSNLKVDPAARDLNDQNLQPISKDNRIMMNGVRYMGKILRWFAVLQLQEVFEQTVEQIL
jgi:hypothetical protein